MNHSKPKSKAVKILIIVAIITLILVAAVLMLRRQVSRKFAAEAGGDIESAKVEVGSISTTVSGSGRLADEDVDDIELPASVEFTEIAVSAGDKIKEGDLLATVDMTTVLTAMKTLQDQLDEYDDEIADAVSGTAGKYVTAPVSGRVKAVYCGYGDDVSRVMYENGALMVLSIDGKMAVTIPLKETELGEAVSVTREDGSVSEGEVHEIDGENAIVTIDDDGPGLGERVKVSSSSGKILGEGELYIHKPLNITGVAGTVSACYYKENTAVSSGAQLIYLSDTAYSANYDAILRERNETEEQLNDLVAIYKEGALYARSSGSVSSVTATTGEPETVEGTQVVMSICPDVSMTVSLSVDETDVLSLSVGQEAEITVSSLGDDTYYGTVTKLETAGTASSGVTYYNTVITLPKEENMLSGMTAKVIIRIEGIDNALIIPSDALHQTSSKSYVYTGYNTETGEYTGMVEVTAGMNNGSYAEITSGLKEGDTVYYEPKDNNMFRFGGYRGGNMPERDFGGEMPSGAPGGEMPSGAPGGMPSGAPGGMPGRG